MSSKSAHLVALCLVMLLVSFAFCSLTLSFLRFIYGLILKLENQSVAFWQGRTVIEMLHFLQLVTYNQSHRREVLHVLKTVLFKYCNNYVWHQVGTRYIGGYFVTYM